MKKVTLIIGLLLLCAQSFAAQRYACKISYQNAGGVKVEDQTFEQPQLFPKGDSKLGLNIDLAGSEVRVTRFNSSQYAFHFFGQSFSATAKATSYKGKADAVTINSLSERLEITCQDI